MQWSEVEPVLKATYRLLDDQDVITPEQVARSLDKPPDDEQVMRALAYLYANNYIGGFTANQRAEPVRIQASERGLQEASGWPRPGGAGAEQVELLLRLLDERINDSATPEEERGKLRKMRDAFASLGRDFAVELLSAYAAKVSGVDD